jgi:hypothetical protein
LPATQLYITDESILIEKVTCNPFPYKDEAERLSNFKSLAKKSWLICKQHLVDLEKTVGKIMF